MPRFTDEAYCAVGLIKSVEEGPEGEWIISGPIHDLQEDYDGDIPTRDGILKGMKMFWRLGRHIDYGHQYLQSLRKGKPDPDFLIGKGIEVFDKDGVPWLKATLYKTKELAKKVYNHLLAGGEMGFSIEGFTKGRDGKHLTDTEIHRITIDPSPKSFGARIQVGVPENTKLLAFAKSLSIAFADEDAFAEADESEPVVKAASGKESKAEANYREGSGARCCGTCAYLIDNGKKAGNGCKKVAGAISLDDVCDYYKRGHTMQKAASADALYTCPKCGKGVYCINCHRSSAGLSKAVRKPSESSVMRAWQKDYPYLHRDAGLELLNNPDYDSNQMGDREATAEHLHLMEQMGGKPCANCNQQTLPYNGKCRHCGSKHDLYKAMTTGEGVVQPGQTGGPALRKQNLRGTVADTRSICASCKNEFTGDGRLCARCKKNKQPVTKSLADALRSAGSSAPEAVAEMVLTKSYVGFDKLKKKLAREGVRDPGAVAAAAGRKKYGKKRFQNYAAQGKKMKNARPAHKSIEEE